MEFPIRPPLNKMRNSSVRRMRRDPSGRGFVHIGNDGILRSFDENLTVLDYEKLSPDQIAERVSRYTGMDMERVKRKYAGVDGRKVQDERQCVEPGPDIMPPGVRNLVRIRQMSMQDHNDSSESDDHDHNDPPTSRRPGMGPKSNSTCMILGEKYNGGGVYFRA